MQNYIPKYVKPGDRPSAREQNRLIGLVRSLSRSLHINGFVDSTGLHTRRALANDAGRTHLAYADGDSPDASSIPMFLDTDTTGEAITAECLIINGASLKYAAPFLNDGNPAFVQQVDIAGTLTWYIIGLPFNGARFG